MARRRICILQMGKHFLYLPIYFAAHRNFFGLLPDDVHIEIERCEAGTDADTYRQLMDESPEFRDDVIAITDPVQVFNTPLKSPRKPAILATLVTNGAFWAVNHGQHTINGLRDLGVFERVIAFPPGTTCYAIAARIAHQSGKATPLAEFIEVVEPGKELLLLTDPQKGKNAFALSPDVLRIESMVNNHTASIELPLGDTAEYNDVLVTALVSYDDFVTKNQDVAQAVVSAVQKALVMTRLRHPDVIRFAADAFRFGDHVSGAVEKAVKADVIPMSTVVAQAHWMNAAKAYFESAHPASTWANDEEAKSLEYFRVCVQPYAAFAEEGIRRVLEGVPSDAANAPPWSRVLRLAIPILATLATPLLGVIPTLGMMVGFWVTWWFARQAAVNRYPFVYWSLISCAITGTLFIFIPVIEALEIRDRALPLGVGLALVLAALSAAGVGYNLHYAKRDKT